MIAFAQDSAIDMPVSIDCYESQIEGDWWLPIGPRGTVILANSSGGTRSSLTNRHLAHCLYRAGFATLILDLFTSEEDCEDRLTGGVQLDFALLANRVETAVAWVKETMKLKHLPVGCLASGSATAAVLIAAARNPERINAIVSREGRPDLAGVRLHTVRTPTMLIVGDADKQCSELNRWALRRLNCDKNLTIVRGATHLVAEPAALGAVSDLAIGWFRRYLTSPARERRSLFSLNWSDRQQRSYA